MNKQRKVVITTTYNEMGIIIDTKAEEVAQPNLQPTCNQLATDCISRKTALDAIRTLQTYKLSEDDDMLLVDKAEVQTELMMLPSAQPEPTLEQIKETAMEMLHGTLHITVDHDISNVYRVWLSQKGTHYGELYYPDYTDEEIQKIQDLEQAQFDKVYELGKQAAQPEIIRCKDCKHGELFSDQYLCHKDMLWREGDFYCGYVERREDG